MWEPIWEVMGSPLILQWLVKDCRPQSFGGQALVLWMVLLNLALGTGAAGTAGTQDLPKAVLHFEPPWVRVFRDDSVTLRCEGLRGPGDQTTLWFHNGSSMPDQGQLSFSFQARIQDSGDYQCQTSRTHLSDPVHLAVLSDWLLLQTVGLEFQKGDPILLKCHGWKNKPVYKVTFYHNGKAIKYFSQNTNFSIPGANASHSGEYYCAGIIGKTKYSSQPVTITIQEPASNEATLMVIVMAVVTGVAVFIIAGIVVTWFRLRRKRLSVTVVDAEEAAKAEAENTITYSLLSHPEASEEPESPDYQNHV